MPNIVFVSVSGICFSCCILILAPNGMLVLRSLMLRTNYVIRVMRIKDKGDKALNQISINR